MVTRSEEGKLELTLDKTTLKPEEEVKKLPPKERYEYVYSYLKSQGMTGCSFTFEWMMPGYKGPEPTDEKVYEVASEALMEIAYHPDKFRRPSLEEDPDF